MAQTKTKITRKPKTNVAKKCFFCSEQKKPTYADVAVLQRFMSDRGKIIGRARSGMCATHQRQLTSSIKHARHLALLPFIVRD
jgi:small subunit ribosomal protein S18